MNPANADIEDSNNSNIFISSTKKVADYTEIPSLITNAN